MWIAQSRGDLPAATKEARQLQALAEAPEAAELGLSGEMVSAAALQALGRTEVWAARFEEAQRDLERSAALARQVGLPYSEYPALAHLAVADLGHSFARAAEHSRQAIDLAERHGWTDEHCAGVAYAVLADMLAWQGRPEEAEPWIQRAERTMRAEAEPAAILAVLCIRGRLELAFGRDADALAAFEAAGRLAGHLPAPRQLVTQMRAWLLCALIRLGDTERAGQALAGLSEHDPGSPETRIATAALRLAQDNAHAAAAALEPVLDGAASGIPWICAAVYAATRDCGDRQFELVVRASSTESVRLSTASSLQGGTRTGWRSRHTLWWSARYLNRVRSVCFESAVACSVAQESPGRVSTM